MKKHHLLCLFLFLSVACSTNKKNGTCHLEETDEVLSFPIDTDTKNNFNIYSIYKDKDGKEYFTFQNHQNNTIHFYDLKRQKPTFKISPPQEGSNGVGHSHSRTRFNTESSGQEQIFRTCTIAGRVDCKS